MELVFVCFLVLVAYRWLGFFSLPLVSGSLDGRRELSLVLLVMGVDLPLVALLWIDLVSSELVVVCLVRL